MPLPIEYYTDPEFREKAVAKMHGDVAREDFIRAYPDSREDERGIIRSESAGTSIDPYQEYRAVSWKQKNTGDVAEKFGIDRAAARSYLDRIEAGDISRHSDSDRVEEVGGFLARRDDTQAGQYKAIHDAILSDKARQDAESQGGVYDAENQNIYAADSRIDEKTNALPAPVYSPKQAERQKELLLLIKNTVPDNIEDKDTAAAALYMYATVPDLDESVKKRVEYAYGKDIAEKARAEIAKRKHDIQFNEVSDMLGALYESELKKAYLDVDMSMQNPDGSFQKGARAEYDRMRELGKWGWIKEKFGSVDQIIQNPALLSGDKGGVENPFNDGDLATSLSRAEGALKNVQKSDGNRTAEELKNLGRKGFSEGVSETWNASNIPIVGMVIGPLRDLGVADAVTRQQKARESARNGLDSLEEERPGISAYRTAFASQIAEGTITDDDIQKLYDTDKQIVFNIQKNNFEDAIRGNTWGYTVGSMLIPGLSFTGEFVASTLIGGGAAALASRFGMTAAKTAAKQIAQTAAKEAVKKTLGRKMGEAALKAAQDIPKTIPGIVASTPKFAVDYRNRENISTDENGLLNYTNRVDALDSLGVGLYNASREYLTELAGGIFDPLFGGMTNAIAKTK